LQADLVWGCWESPFVKLLKLPAKQARQPKLVMVSDKSDAQVAEMVLPCLQQIFADPSMALATLELPISAEPEISTVPFGSPVLSVENQAAR
jgi:hypothetical protein